MHAVGFVQYYITCPSRNAYPGLAFEINSKNQPANDCQDNPCERCATTRFRTPHHIEISDGDITEITQLPMVNGISRIIYTSFS